MCDDSEGMMCDDSEGMMCLYTVSEESCNPCSLALSRSEKNVPSYGAEFFLHHSFRVGNEAEYLKLAFCFI